MQPFLNHLPRVLPRRLTRTDNAECAWAQPREERAHALGASNVGSRGHQGTVLGVRSIVREGLRIPSRGHGFGE